MRRIRARAPARDRRPAAARSERTRRASRRMQCLPRRAGVAFTDHRCVRVLAHGRAAAVAVAAWTARAPDRGGARRGAGRARRPALGRAALARGRARHLVQAALERSDPQPRQPAGAARARAPTTRRTATPTSRSCTCSTASCGSTIASCIPAITTAPSRARLDHRVWSETGCTCFLVTSAHDELR